MDALEYCIAKATPDGSARYYAVLLLPPRTRAAVTGLLALEQALRESVEDCSEASVAARKLGWWHEELVRTLGGEPRHPVARCIAEHAPGALDSATIHALLAGARHRAHHPQFRDAGELDASCLETAGVVGRCCGRVAAPGDPAQAEALAHVFAACERVRLLALPRRAGLAPHTGVPLDLLAQCAATPGEVDSGGASPAAVRLRRSLLDAAGQALDRAQSRLADARGFAAIRLHLARAELRSIARGGYAASGTAGAPLPLSLLWIAWRHRPRRSMPC